MSDYPNVVCPHCLRPIYLQNDYIPKDKVKARIKELEAKERVNSDYTRLYINGGIKELKDLLSKEEDEK